MFNFLYDMGNYEDRKVDCYEDGDLYISTAKVNDSKAPYETAVAHPNYNNGKLVIVENYWSKEDAQAGHERWVETMTSLILPESLRDVGMSDVNQILDLFGGDDWRNFEEDN